MAKLFRSVDEVEYVFGYTFTPDQAEMVAVYLFTGTRPAPGCWVCNEGYIRKITGEIDAFEDQVERGEAKWPWPERLSA